MNENIQLVLFGITVLGSLFSCGSAVVSYMRSCRPASVELQSQVDDLAVLVEKILKTQRKEKMTRVRSAALEDRDNSGDDTGLPAPSVEVGRITDPHAKKLALLNAARQKGFRV